MSASTAPPQLKVDQGVWRLKGGTEFFGTITKVHWQGGPNWTYDVLIDGQTERNVVQSALRPCLLCPECGDEPASGGGRGLECRGRSTLA